MTVEHECYFDDDIAIWSSQVEIEQDAAIIGPPAAGTVATAPSSQVATLIRPGSAWNGTERGSPVLVPYSFATRDTSYYDPTYNPGNFGFPSGEGFSPGRSEAFDATQRAWIGEALALWEQVCGVTFIEVPDSLLKFSSGIRFALENIDPQWAGYTASSLPYGATIVLQRTLLADAALNPGTYDFYTVLHEIGHAVGLKHPFEGSPTLPQGEDSSANTVMSYTNARNYTHLGPIDIAAAQHLYGTPEAEAAAPVRWARGPGGSLITIGNDAPNTITGLDIRDRVRAGGGNDVIRTQAGDDDILPGSGDDTVYGGDGFDTVWAETPRRHAVAINLGGEKELTLSSGRDVLVDIEAIRFFDGQLSFHANSAAGRVFRLYGAALGREPDPVGLGQWAQGLDIGATTLKAVAASFVESAEFTARFGAPDNAGFVILLYANVLGRAPDAPGLAFWTNAMAAGTSRGEALLGFSEAAEYKQATAATYHQGLWAPDPEAVDVLRAYLAVLDRLPDAGGLAHWTAAREAGLAQAELVEGFVGSAEFQGRFGGLSNRAFVEQLYRTALDRDADAAGLAAWTGLLDSGTGSRSGVALGFSSSVEMTIKATPLVEDGFLLA